MPKYYSNPKQSMTLLSGASLCLVKKSQRDKLNYKNLKDS